MKFMYNKYNFAISKCLAPKYFLYFSITVLISSKPSLFLSRFISTLASLKEIHKLKL